MVIRLPELLLFAEDVWKKALARLGPATDKLAAKMPTAENPTSPSVAATAGLPTTTSRPPAGTMTTQVGAPVTAAVEPTTTTTTTTTTMAPSSGNVTPAAAAPQGNHLGQHHQPATKKRCWRRRTVHFTVFLAVFSTILSLLWIYTITAEIRRKAFDMNMMRDYVLDHISMDNPDLVAYIRNMQLRETLRQEPLNATQTPEEQFVAAQLQNKRDGVYFEYMSRVGATSTTSWLESELGWHGAMVFTDPRSFYEAYRSKRNNKTRVLHACLSTDKDTREIFYHQELDVQVTKLGEGPNSLGLAKESLPAPRLICFPLYSILLAYNATTIDYLSLDSSEVQDGLVLDTIPWDVIRISVLAIHWNAMHHTEAETKDIVEKLASHSYERVKALSTGKLIFVYNHRLKV